jgi:hypothetical protein
MQHDIAHIHLSGIGCVSQHRREAPASVIYAQPQIIYQLNSPARSLPAYFAPLPGIHLVNVAADRGQFASCLQRRRIGDACL